MKQITITPRTQDRECRKCGIELKIGEIAMVQRNQSGRKYCMPCWKRICM